MTRNLHIPHPEIVEHRSEELLLRRVEVARRLFPEDTQQVDHLFGSRQIRRLRSARLDDFAEMHQGLRRQPHHERREVDLLMLVAVRVVAVIVGLVVRMVVTMVMLVVVPGMVVWLEARCRVW